MTVDAMIAEELRPDMYSYLNLDGGHTAYIIGNGTSCLLYTSPSPRDYAASRMPSSA